MSATKTGDKSKRDSRTKKVVIQALKIIEIWKETVASGKPVLSDILSHMKQRKDPSELSEDLQSLSDKLLAIAAKFPMLIKDFEATSEKLDLNNSNINESSLSSDLNLSVQNQTMMSSSKDEDIRKHLSVIQDKLEEQSKVMQAIAEEIASSKNVDHAVFQATAWTMQPKLDDDYFHSVQFLRSNFS